MRKFTAITVLFLCFSVLMSAQKGPEIGGFIGATHYFGDLNPTYQLKRLGPAVGIIGRYNINPRFSVKFAGTYGHLKAYDSDSDNAFQQARNLSFRTGVVDGSLQMEFNFFEYIHGSDQSYYTPYIFLGASVYYANPKAELDGEWIPLQPLGTEGQPIGGEYALVNPAIAYGIGFKTDLNPLWSVNIELSGRYLFSDYIDDVSTIYPNPLLLRTLRGVDAVRLSDRSAEVVAEPIGQTGRQRGNSKNNDSYAFLTVGLVYYLGDVQCPSISKPHAKAYKPKKRKRR